MAHIGNSPPSFFTAVSSEVFSANGTATSFTLSRSISNLSDLELIVDNIQQNPFSGSYSVSGSTLTFSEAPSAGSNNIVVTYRQATIGSTIPTPNTVGNNALQSNLSLTGTTTTQHIVPSANITYDLGTSAMRYRDLYLSGGTITLGDVTLTTNGSTFSVANTTGGVLPSALGNTTVTGTLQTSNTITVGNSTVNSVIHSTGITANSFIANSTGIYTTTNTATIGTTLYVVANGNVGIGRSDPGYHLHVNGANATATIQDSSSNGSRILLQSTNSAVYIGSTYGTTNIPTIFTQAGTTDGVERMRIDISGRVTIPNQPAFFAVGLPGGSNLNANTGAGVITFATEQLDRNNNWSGNTFTAPVSGVYYMGFEHMYRHEGGDITFVILKNGTSASYNNPHTLDSGGFRPTWSTSTTTWVGTLAQNDNIQFSWSSSGVTSTFIYGGGLYTKVYGYLLG